MGSPDRPRDLEPSVLEEERVVVAILVHAPHLHALNTPLVCGVRDGLEAQVDDAVRKELLLQSGGPSLEGRFFRDEEARDSEVSEPLEEPERLRPPVVEVEDQLERVPRIDREEPEIPFLAKLQDLALQYGEERLSPGRRRIGHRADLRDHLLEMLAAAAQIQDRQGFGNSRRLEAEDGHVLQEAAGALFQRDVQAGRSLERVVEQDVVGERRLHRPARASDQDDVTLGDPASQHVVVESADVGLHERAGHALPHVLMARVTRNRPSSKTIARYPVSCRVPRIFTTRRRRCASRSETICIRRCTTPSARKSSSQRPWRTCPAMSQSGRSVTTKLVTFKSRSHSNKRYISRRRSLNFARTSSASSESIAMRSRPFCSLIEAIASRSRSEEHTSELQSHLKLVCRLLLEKKKKKIIMLCLVRKKHQ